MKKPKPKRGRPALPPKEKRQHIHLRLHPRHIAKALALGKESLTRGVELALERA